MKVYLMVTVLQALLLGFQGITYILVQRIQGEYHDVQLKCDRKIPLQSQWVYIYILWYPLIAVYPLYLYSCSERLYIACIAAAVADILGSMVVYVLFPTSFQRPVPSGVTLSDKILCKIYLADYKGLNCMPSMHCSMCYIIMCSSVITSANGFMPISVCLCIVVLALLIILSTLFTKQHVLADVIAALPLGIFCCWFGMIIIDTLNLQ